MKKNEFKVLSEGKEVATISHSEDGMSVKCTEEGKKLCAHFRGCC